MHLRPPFFGDPGDDFKQPPPVPPPPSLSYATVDRVKKKGEKQEDWYEILAGKWKNKK